MANYIDKLTSINRMYSAPAMASTTTLPAKNQDVKTQPLGTNILERFLQNQGISAAAQVKPVSTQNANGTYHNNLRTRFKNNGYHYEKLRC